MKKAIYGILAFTFLAALIFLLVSGHLRQGFYSYLFYKGDRKMSKQDYLAALGYYEKILGSDSAHCAAHLRAAAALDSLRRPVESKWHYEDAKRFSDK